MNDLALLEPSDLVQGQGIKGLQLLVWRFSLKSLESRNWRDDGEQGDKILERDVWEGKPGCEHEGWWVERAYRWERWVSSLSTSHVFLQELGMLLVIRKSRATLG
jgi:hypothetical protein